MKQVLNNRFFIFMLGVLVSSGVVYAESLLARDITFDNSKSHLKDANNQDVTNIQDAVDALYRKANNSSGSKTICTYVASEFGNSSDHFSVGTKYSCEVKDNTSYNFYVLTNHTDSVDLIMEHNITELVGSRRTMNYQSAINYFRNGAGVSLNWEVPVDIPSAQAVADAVGNTSWDKASNDSNGWFCLGLHDKNSCINNGQWDSATSAGISAIAPYKWLINYTRECTVYGCDEETSLSEGQADGYWTKDMVINSGSQARAWLISRSGFLFSDDVTSTPSYGVRPVISILKSNIS